MLFGAGASFAQDEYGESTFSVMGYIQAQSGVFVPLGLDGIFDKDRAFQDHESIAWQKRGQDNFDYTNPCDPAVDPTKVCWPTDHGGRAGDASMFRGTLQLEADWAPSESINLHAVFRGVRALALEQDYWAQPPNYYSVSNRPEWVLDNIYNEIDLRELYLDIYPNEWLSFRIGRQQVTWGETGQYRLLDVINPVDNSWHLGPLESFQDTRIPLWIAKALIEFPDIEHNLEIVWVPGIDRPEDSVTVPLTFVGAWGLPPTNTPSPFQVEHKKFLYPSRNMPESMRGGFRWKGNLGSRSTYSLVYYYTHQLSPPVPTQYDLKPLVVDGQLIEGVYDQTRMETLYLAFPRQHILGFTFDITIDNPIGVVAKLEAAWEPDRTFPRTSSSPYATTDETFPNYTQRYQFNPVEKDTFSYAVVLMRPTMIRWLNPTQNFLFVLQWMHTIIPNIKPEESADLVNIPGFNDYRIKEHSWTLVAVAGTTYFNGFFSPRVVAAFVYPDSGFVSFKAAFRIFEHWRAELAITDIYGSDAYAGLGLFRDRDEINLRIRYQF